MWAVTADDIEVVPIEPGFSGCTWLSATYALAEPVCCSVMSAFVIGIPVEGVTSVESFKGDECWALVP